MKTPEMDAAQRALERDSPVVMIRGWGGLKGLLMLLIGMSFLYSVFIIAVVVGIENTPYETRDSQGRAMGFNDRLSWEHYGILLGNADPRRLFRGEHWYDCFLLAMHGVAGWGVLRQSGGKPRGLRLFFASQLFLFPVGWIGIVGAWFVLRLVVLGHLDREGVIDIPFVWVMAHPAWILCSVAALIGLWRLQKAAAKVKEL